MGESDSEGVPYDDDFEEASDEDRARSGCPVEALGASSASASLRPSPYNDAGGGTTPSKGSRRARRMASGMGGAGAGAGSMAVLDGKAASSAPQPAAAPLELTAGGRAGTPGSTAGAGAAQRVVRGKVSVGAEDADLRRPPTGDSLPSPGQGAGQAANQAAAAAAAAAGKPVWLQFGEPAAAARSREQLRSREQQPAPGSSRVRPESSSAVRAGSGRRPPLDPDPFLDAGHEPGHASRGSVAASGRPRRGEDPFEAESGRGAEADDRKMKRLQQEMQRLTQRLQEAELFSAQDDMLPKFTLEEVEIGVQIAQGGFSSVHHASWRCTPCALKKIFDPVITEELKSEFENEVRMLRLLRHPHIVTLMAVCRIPPALSILTEYVTGGSLFELLHSPPQQRPKRSIEPEPAAVFPVVLQAARAVAYLHSMLVVHRDIKSHNVLLTEGNRPIAKLCDFGLARMRSELCTGTMQWAGTAAYMAPELFAKKRYSEMVDVFAFGTMMWEVASTEIPHANMDVADIAHRVQSKDGAGLPVAHAWPKSLKALLKSTLAVDPDSRPSMLEVAKQLEKVILELPAPD